MKESKIKKKNIIFKKFFIKFSRFLGYELMDQSDLSIPTSNFNSERTLSTLGKKSLTPPMGTLQITRSIKSLDIILRTCASVKMLTQSKERIFEKEKYEYSLRSLQSIVSSINSCKQQLKNLKIKITIIDHKSDKKIVDKFHSILKNVFFNYEVLFLDYEKYNSKISNQNEIKDLVTENQKSNMSNIHQSLDIAKNCEDLIYFVEDDYLHTRGSILELLLTYEKFSSQLNSELFLCPADYPYLYRDIENTNILLGDKSHWRKINQSLCTFMTSRKMIDKYYEKLTKMCTFEHYPFEKPLHDIFRSELCFSPIPSIANHCTNINSVYGLSPNVDWKRLW